MSIRCLVAVVPVLLYIVHKSIDDNMDLYFGNVTNSSSKALDNGSSLLVHFPDDDDGVRFVDTVDSRVEENVDVLPDASSQNIQETYEREIDRSNSVIKK